MNSFVSRVRGTVRKSLESSDVAHHTAVDHIGESLKPNVRLPKVAVGIRELDPDELSGAGARAIFEPLGNILSAKFVGVNKAFCDMFGFDRSDIPSNTFKILQGPLTDTRHLQEVWSEVRKGADKALTSNLYTKAGEQLAIRLEILIRSSEMHQSRTMMVIRASPIQQPSGPRDPASPRAFSRRAKITGGLIASRSAEGARNGGSPEGFGNRVVKRLDGLTPPMSDYDRAGQRSRSGETAAGLRRRQPSTSPTEELATLREKVASMVPKEQLRALEAENARLTSLFKGMVPQNQLDSAQAEILRLKRLLQLGREAYPNSNRLNDLDGNLRASRTSDAGSTAAEDMMKRSPSDVARSIKARRASTALREVFPRSIADAIMEGRTLQPINKDCVSVFFSDVVGFTSMSSDMEAGKVSNMLNRLFAKFDDLAQIHGVQKIDVIGDAYLAATNVIEDQSSDHAARIARFAIDAMAAAQATRLDETGDDPACVRIRIGIHCGSVSASVLGSQGFKYTLIGDTVNTASRMESTSLPCEIQCSESSARLITEQAPDVGLKPRLGGIDVKGKGHMRTFWVSAGSGAPAAGNAAAASFCCERALDALMPTGVEPVDRLRPVSTSRLALRRSVKSIVVPGAVPDGSSRNVAALL